MSEGFGQNITDEELDKAQTMDNLAYLVERQKEVISTQKSRLDGIQIAANKAIKELQLPSSNVSGALTMLRLIAAQSK